MLKTTTQNRLIIMVAIFMMAFTNVTFIKNVQMVYPINGHNALFLISLLVLSICVMVLLLSLVCFKYTIKPVLIGVLLTAASTAYFMDTYNVVIDDLMIDNVMKTDANETMDLLSIKQILYFLLLGVLPAFLVVRVRIVDYSVKEAIIKKLLMIVGSVGLAIVIVLSLGNFYSSFFREHKPLRFYSNPVYPFYSLFKYGNGFIKSQTVEFTRIGEDAHIVESPSARRKLLVFVVGETVRGDHFSLNGYAKKTNPFLEKTSAISFDNVWSCGTSTAYSVPCMFSLQNRTNFSKTATKAMDNALDIAQRAGVNVLWLDNNSSSKGVADRVEYQEFKRAENNTVCDTECRDVGMIRYIDSYLSEHPTGDVLIVLHQMGNHGPAYYKRYPSDFEVFKPVCKTNQLEACSVEEISNAYDNALRYTDYFLAQTIAYLQSKQTDFSTAMIYASDHGESLGEKNMYLHGLPYAFAPDAQKHVAMVIWSADDFVTLNKTTMQNNRHQKYSHDNLFHTLLGALAVKTTVYDATMDMGK